ncbi:MAG: energy-coupling factor transporter transmembrane component T family protein [Christensenellales bacterium]
MIGFPVHEMAMMMSIALRFIPTLAEETDRIRKGAGARARILIREAFLSGRQFDPLLVPLFVSAFRRADELATAMKARYHGGEGRTKLNVLHAWAGLSGTDDYDSGIPAGNGGGF